MISLAPLKNRQEIAEIFKEKKFEFNEFSGCVTAKNGNEILGICLYYLTNERMTVLHIEPIENIPLADGILRSTLHVAAERSIMDTFYGDGVPEEFLNKIGFIKNSETKSLDIDKLFKSCCECGK